MNSHLAAHGLVTAAPEAVRKWVEEIAALTEPERIFWCDGSEAEQAALYAAAVADGILQPLNPEKLPGCYYHRSNPNDVARVEQCTFICTPTEEEAGPTNNCSWCLTSWAPRARP
jgi:phosphoenolpyruvate carboxykinase (GTP)